MPGLDGELQFQKLIRPDKEVVEAFNRWGNDPELVKYTRPSRNKQELIKEIIITREELEQRAQMHPYYLIFLGRRLIGEMNYQVDPTHLYREIPGSAWIGIVIGEKSAWGRGIGTRAMKYLEGEIKKAGLHRIELGVFEFNTRAYHLYQKLGYREIGRIDSFTYWKGEMWQDIRMEKKLSNFSRR